MADPTENGDPNETTTTPADGGEGGESTETTETTETTTTPEEDPFKFEDDGAAPPDPDDKGKKTDTPGDSEELDPADKATIQKEAQNIVDKALEPLRAEQEKTRVSSEWAKTLSDFPELKNFEGKILRYANHPSYKGQPITKAILDVAGVDVFVKIGAQRAKAADTKAKETANGTTTQTQTRADTSNTDPNAIPSFVGMKPAEMKQWINKAKQMNRG